MASNAKSKLPSCNVSGVHSGGGGDAEKLSRSKKRTKPTNLVARLKSSESLGERLRHFSQFPRGFVEGYQSRFKNMKEVPVTIHELALLVKKDTKGINLSNPHFMQLIETLHEPTEYATDEKDAILEIYYSGGIEILVDVLIKALYDPTKDINKDIEIMDVSSWERSVVRDILQILHQVGRTVPNSLSHLYKNRYLLHLLFSLIALDDSRLYSEATILLEEMFLSDPKSVRLDMRTIACLPAVLNKRMFHIQQAHLYHILVSAIAVGESIMGIDSSLQEYDSWLLDDSKAKLNVINQEYLLSFPVFVENLFQVTTETLQAAIPDNIMQILFGMMSESVDMSFSQMNAEYAEANRDHPVYRVAVYCEKSARADAYLMLSTLLTGKCREQMQQNVIKYDLIQGLERSIDKVVWDGPGGLPRLDDPRSEDIDGQDQATQIHYFRLIYSIADHHIHRYLLLNEKELQEIQGIAETCSVELSEEFAEIDRSKCCQKEDGLLVEIIRKMKNESCTSYLRFWMARTLESFLRGARCLYDQIFLMRRGLIQDLFDILLLHDGQSSDVIQGHFDLLSSLMINNKLAFIHCSEIVDTNEKFFKLCSMIESNLVDSNMFVRSMILSLHYFESYRGKFHDFIKSSRLLMHYLPLKKRVEVIFNLVQILDIKTLSQENVSCLNTSIIILLIADLNGHLPKYLSVLASHSEGGVCKGRDLLTKLRDLLEFWLKHYSYSFKEQDVKSLEEVTGFKFKRWKELVHELIKADTASPRAILRYLDYLDPDVTQMSSLRPTCSRTC